MVLFIGCATIPTMENTPTDFRGIKFGININDLSNMIIEYQDESIIKAIRDNENLEVFGIKVEKIRYDFYKKRLYMVKIYFQKTDTYNDIQATLIQNHGLAIQQQATQLRYISGALQGNTHLVPNQPTDILVWYGEPTCITLEYVTGEGEGYVIYQYMPILKEIN